MRASLDLGHSRDGVVFRSSVEREEENWKVER
jgi:hypothetical protein